MGAVASRPFTVARSDDVWIWDTHGRRYLDACASLWYANLGHGRPEIADAVARQLRTLDAYNMFADFANGPALELADRLSDKAPVSGCKVFLGSGGGDAIDTAAKLARAYHRCRGFPTRTHLISREHSYHGTHGVGTGIAGIAANAVHFGDLVPDSSVIPCDDADGLEVEIQRIGADRVAAFFCEPVIGAGGVLAPPEGYLERVDETCSHYGVLLVADCVIAGFGRLGTWFGIYRWPVWPDLVTLAKGITGGAPPLGAVVASPEVAEPFFTRIRARRSCDTVRLMPGIRRSAPRRTLPWTSMNVMGSSPEEGSWKCPSWRQSYRSPSTQWSPRSEAAWA